MKLPDFGAGNRYSHEQFTNWIDEHKRTIIDFHPVKAVFIPPAKEEQLSDLNVCALSQINEPVDYSCVVVISHIKVPLESNGVFFPETELTTFKTAFRDINIALPENINEKINKIKHTGTNLYRKAIEFLDKTDIEYSLPFIAERFKDLPIIPMLYKKCDSNVIHKFMNAFYNLNALIIIVGRLSCSFSIQEIRSFDSSTISKIIAMDDSVNSTQSNAYIALNSLIKISDEKYLRPKVLSYQIVESSQRYTNKAGCASIVFYR